MIDRIRLGGALVALWAVLAVTFHPLIHADGAEHHAECALCLHVEGDLLGDLRRPIVVVVATPHAVRAQFLALQDVLARRPARGCALLRGPPALA